MILNVHVDHKKWSVEKENPVAEEAVKEQKEQKERKAKNLVAVREKLREDAEERAEKVLDTTKIIYPNFPRPKLNLC